MAARHIGLLVGAAALLASIFLPTPAGMEREAFIVAGLVVLMAAWWMTEALPLTATALMPFIVLPFAGVMSAKETASAYYSDILFLLLGGGFIALTIERTGLHRRLALGILSLLGGRGGQAGLLLAFMIAAAILSMLISNTSTTLIMMPMAVAVLAGPRCGLIAEPAPPWCPHSLSFFLNLRAADEQRLYILSLRVFSRAGLLHLRDGVFPFFHVGRVRRPGLEAVVEHGHDAAARGRRALGRLGRLLLRAAARAEEAEDAVEAEDEAHYLFGAELLATDDVPASKDGASGGCGVATAAFGLGATLARPREAGLFASMFCPPLPLGSGKPERARRGRAALPATKRVDWLAVAYTSALMCRLAGWGVARGLAAWPRRPRP